VRLCASPAHMRDRYRQAEKKQRQIEEKTNGL